MCRLNRRALGCRSGLRQAAIEGGGAGFTMRAVYCVKIAYSIFRYAIGIHLRNLMPPQPKTVPQHSALRRCVTALRNLALSLEPDTLIGSEDELLVRYGVSRPTLRQAAAIVAQEQLLEARRGVRGGYFAMRPTVRGVAHMAAVFLQMQNAGLREIMLTIAPLHIEMAKLAAQRMTPTKRDKILAFLDAQKKWRPEADFRDFLRLARNWETLLGELCENPVLALYDRILIDLSATLAPGEDIYLNNPQRMQNYMSRTRAMAEAILDRDPDRAGIIARRASTAGQEWVSGALQRPISWLGK